MSQTNSGRKVVILPVTLVLFLSLSGILIVQNSFGIAVRVLAILAGVHIHLLWIALRILIQFISPLAFACELRVLAGLGEPRVALFIERVLVAVVELRVERGDVGLLLRSILLDGSCVRKYGFAVRLIQQFS